MRDMKILKSENVILIISTKNVQSIYNNFLFITDEYWGDDEGNSEEFYDENKAGVAKIVMADKDGNNIDDDEDDKDDTRISDCELIDVMEVDEACYNDYEYVNSTIPPTTHIISHSPYQEANSLFSSTKSSTLTQAHSFFPPKLSTTTHSMETHLVDSSPDNSDFESYRGPYINLHKEEWDGQEILTDASDQPEVLSFPSLEESWLVTPAPCFEGLESVAVVKGSMEDLLLKGPTVSIYHKFMHEKHRRLSGEDEVEEGSGEGGIGKEGGGSGDGGGVGGGGDGDIEGVGGGDIEGVGGGDIEGLGGGGDGDGGDVGDGDIEDAGMKSYVGDDFVDYVDDDEDDKGEKEEDDDEERENASEDDDNENKNENDSRCDNETKVEIKEDTDLKEASNKDGAVVGRGELNYLVDGSGDGVNSGKKGEGNDRSREKRMDILTTSLPSFSVSPLELFNKWCFNASMPREWLKKLEGRVEGLDELVGDILSKRKKEMNLVYSMKDGWNVRKGSVVPVMFPAGGWIVSVLKLLAAIVDDGIKKVKDGKNENDENEDEKNKNKMGEKENKDKEQVNKNNLGCVFSASNTTVVTASADYTTTTSVTPPGEFNSELRNFLKKMRLPKRQRKIRYNNVSNNFRKNEYHYQNHPHRHLHQHDVKRYHHYHHPYHSHHYQRTY